jgi:hypothetical protein
MEKAWSVLEELGAVNEGGKLTPLGRHMVCNSAIFYTCFGDFSFCIVYAAYRSSTREGLDLKKQAFYPVC